MALISSVQKQVVDRDKLISNEDVLDGISLASVLPGPLAVNVIAFIGYRLKGIKGAIVCFSGILIPSFLLMLILSALYQRFGNIPEFGSFFAGVLPAVAAIIVSVAVGMFRKNVKDWKQIILVILSGVITFFSKSYFSTLGIIIISALIGYFLYRTNAVGSGQSAVPTPTTENPQPTTVSPSAPVAPAAPAAPAAAPSPAAP